MGKVRPRLAKKPGPGEVVVDLRGGHVVLSICDSRGRRVQVTPSLDAPRPEPCPVGAGILARMARILGGYTTRPSEEIPLELREAAVAAGADGRTWRAHFQDCPACVQVWARDALEHVARTGGA